MSTFADLIQGAFRVLGVLAAEETPTASEQANALVALNDLFDSWSNEELLIYNTNRATFTLTPGHNPHTLGSGGDFNTTRPLRIDRASIVLASSPSTELPLTIQSDADWQLTQGKVNSGIPVFLWVDTEYPLAKLYLNPVPVNADSLVLYMWQQPGHVAISDLQTSVPPGYVRALRFNLAKELAPEYGVTMSQEAADIANESKASLKRVNYKPSYLRSDGALLRRGPFNIKSGDRG